MVCYAKIRALFIYVLLSYWIWMEFFPFIGLNPVFTDNFLAFRGLLLSIRPNDYIFAVKLKL